MIGVSSPIELRIKRAMERDKVSREEVLKRMEQQLDEEVKMSKCDFVLINDEQQLLIPQVLELHEKLIGLSKQKMMDNFPHWVDHIIAFVFCIALPLYAARQRTKGTALIHFSSDQKNKFISQAAFRFLSWVPLLYPYG